MVQRKITWKNCIINDLLNKNNKNVIFINIIFLIVIYICVNIIFKIFIGDWGLGIGDWGLGIGPNPQSPIPNPQSPIPILEKVAEFFKKHLFEDSNTNKEINLDSKDKGKKKYSDNKFNEDKDIIDDYVNINMDKFEKNSVKSISTNSLDQINDFEDLQSEINFENKLEDPLAEAGTFKAQKDMN
jgi:hypothetical protein